jgi:hypothetical protein
MLIERTRNTIKISRNADDADFACIGVARTYFMILDVMFVSDFPRKPHVDYTMGDLENLYDAFLAKKRTIRA